MAVSTNQGFKSFVPCPALLPDYLYYYVLAARTLILQYASGTTFLEVSGRKARARVNLPKSFQISERTTLIGLETVHADYDNVIIVRSRE
jgi:hypothetical protein